MAGPRLPVQVMCTPGFGRGLLEVAGGLGDLVAVDFPDGDRQLVSPDVIEHLD